MFIVFTTIIVSLHRVNAVHANYIVEQVQLYAKQGIIK
jgi:hypothetical protein